MARSRRAVLGTLGAVAGSGCLGVGEGPARPPLTVRPGADGGEQCLLPRTLADDRDVRPGQQVRIGRPESDSCGLFTVVGRAAELTVTERGRERLELDEGTDVLVEPTVETPPDAPYPGTFGESVSERSDDVLVCAPHGGEIEPYTDGQTARLAASMDATAWVCRGTWPDGSAFDRWHVTSTAIAPASFPALAGIADRPFRQAVAFHGADIEGVVVGGGAPDELRDDVRDAVDEAVPVPVELADGGTYGGDSLGNVVNWTAEAGVQIEQGMSARVDHGAAIADAVERALAPL
jgi:phage replication-related protein YjqB (UPF0714/DUF867 family)